jgi:glutamyl-tRNA reductase
MIGLIGISYKTAPLELREKYSLSKNEIIPFSDFLQSETGISDIVVLSTCNRTEIYFSQCRHEFHEAANMVYKALKRFKKLEIKLWHSFYKLANKEAVMHLLGVASGIDSMIVGEDQIIGQIKDSYVFCTEAGLTDAVLMRLFQKAFATSKRVRTETQIMAGTTSISSAAVQKCASMFPGLEDRKGLLIGAGETGCLVLQSLSKNGVQKLTVANRTLEKAVQLARKYNCETLPIDQVEEYLHLFDVVIVATSSTMPLITRSMAKSSTAKRNGALQVFVDISVPRNVEPEVESLDAVALFTIDDLQTAVNTNLEKRKENISAANEIINEIAHEYCEWLATRSLRPAIQTITNNLAKITKDELSGYNNFNSDEMKQAIDEFSQHLTQKYTRLFIKNLKEMTANGKKGCPLEFVNGLFYFDGK